MLVRDGFSTDQQMGELEVCEDGRVTRYPTYTCAHCNAIIVMRPDRVRPRQKCFRCFGLICEKNEICRTYCTPLHAVSRDHFEGAGEWGKWVNALMAGATSVQEAHEKGLVLSG